MLSSLDELKFEFNYLVEDDLVNLATKEKFKYGIVEDDKYELCVIFRTSNKGSEDLQLNFYKDRWLHEVGEQCLGRKVRELDGPRIKSLAPRELPID
ncbi:MAG: hypothetical protein ABIE43_00830 [Patescibacteria group bacterium]